MLMEGGAEMRGKRCPGKNLLLGGDSLEKNPLCTDSTRLAMRTMETIRLPTVTKFHHWFVWKH